MADKPVVVTPRLVVIKRRLRGVRRRLLWVFVAFGVGSSLTWYYRKAIIALLMLPAHEQLSASGRPVFTSPTDVFGIVFQLVIVGGLVVAAPVAAYQITWFIGPFLHKRQRRFVAIFLTAGFVCFVLGASFAYFVLLPTGINFLMRFSMEIADPMIRISEYMKLVLGMIFWLGLIFELPLAMFLLSKMRIISYQRIKRFRIYSVATAFMLGAIITPTFDIVNQTMVAVPIVILYEVGVFFAWLARPRTKKVR
jgi:sec-independent protein translocase protein TatC